MSERSILVHHPDGSTQAFKLVKPATTIGRADTNDLVLPDNSVSRVHAQIEFQNGSAPRITDLKSANGVTLNGKLTAGPTEILPEDVVLIGPYKLVYTITRVSLTSETEWRPDPFRIEQAPVELNKLQEQPRLLQIPDTSIELRQLELLHEVGMRLARTESVADVTEAAVSLLFKITGVQRATLMRWDEHRQEVQDGQVRARTGIDLLGPAFDPRRLVLSRTILSKVREENRPLHIQDASSEAGLEEAASIVRAGIQAAFCSPLTFEGRMMGVLYADNLSTPNAFSQADFRLFTTIAAQTGLALASALSRGELRKIEVEQAAMRLYIPPQIVDQIAATGGEIELGGLMQQVTVLFADIRGFSRISERMDARDVVFMLNEFFTAMTDAILDSGGTLDKYIGDCVMALFGAPVPAGDDADRAVRAAIAMQRGVFELNRSRVARGLKEIQMGVGVHTGCAVVGNIGSIQRMQYTAIGDTVNVAARLVSYAAGGQILISSDCVNSVANSGSFKPMGEAQLKGRDQKVDVYFVPWR